MNTERDDDTRPLPRGAAQDRPAGDHPTTPIPRADAGRGEEPTRDAPTAQLRPEPTTERITPPSGSAAVGSAAVGSAAVGSAASESAASESAAGGSAAGGGLASGSPVGGTSGGPPSVGGSGEERAGSSAAYAADRPADTTVGTAPGTWPVTPEPPVSTSMRVGTVVWGLVLAIIGAGVIAIAAGAQFDLELVLIGLLALAGMALVVGSIVTSARRHRQH